MKDKDLDFYRFDHWYANKRGVPCTCPTCRRKRKRKSNK